MGRICWIGWGDELDEVFWDGYVGRSNVTYMTDRYEWMGWILDGKGGIDASDGLDARDWYVDRIRLLIGIRSIE